MEILQLTTEIDDEGQLKINLPTNLEAGKVDLVVIVNPVTEKDKKQKPYDFSDLVGRPAQSRWREPKELILNRSEILSITC